MPYRVQVCPDCEAIIENGVDPFEHGSEDERCVNHEREQATETVELFTPEEMARLRSPLEQEVIDIAEEASEFRADRDYLREALRAVEAIGNEPVSTIEKVLGDVDRMRRLANHALNRPLPLREARKLMSADTLTDAQAEVLRLVGAGIPLTVMQDVVAGSLWRRGLVDASWTRRITSAGREALAAHEAGERRG